MFIIIFSIPVKASETNKQKICDNFGGTGLNEVVVVKFLDELKSVIKRKDYSKIAKKFNYPIDVKIDGEKVSLKSEVDFLAVSSKVFTDDYRKKIMNSKPNDRVCNSQGLGLNHGALWFRAPNWSKKPNVLKVVAINN